MTIERRCGDCQLCCRILPIKEIGKPAHTKCIHQRFAKGCAIYERRPMGCQLWSCRWLVNDDADDMPRPDRAGYVIDIVPDFITIQDEDGNRSPCQVIQIWNDPKQPLAYRDPALARWLDRQYEREGLLGLVRFSSKRAIVLWPPAITKRGWVEMESNLQEHEHSAKEIVETLGGAT